MQKPQRFSSPALFPDNSPDLDLLDMELPLASCSAQEIMAALMLRHHSLILMRQILTDLEDHAEMWESFVLAPALPSADSVADAGTLVCLRDLHSSWNADTLYVLTRNADTARSLQSVAQGWNCSDITLYPPKRVKRLAGVTGAKRLISMRWTFRKTVEPGINFDHVYQSKGSKLVMDEMATLEDCTPQQLIAGLIIQADSNSFHAPTILEDLEYHSEWWRSFVLGPPLPNTKTGTTNRLNVLQQLPKTWCDDCLYIWAWDNDVTTNLRSLAQEWHSDNITIIAGD
ncbi:MAG TPA: hypothetical protein V6C65_33755, partial [Allocoleopsis sp.]